MITLDDLRFIDALERAGSLSAAARSLNVTPPALSMRLKKLERALSVNLVVRSSRHVRFTSEGERLVAEAQGFLERINALPGAAWPAACTWSRRSVSGGYTSPR
jgi:DNA-binding transcriptional LysR family regulator